MRMSVRRNGVPINLGQATQSRFHGGAAATGCHGENRGMENGSQHALKRYSVAERMGIPHFSYLFQAHAAYLCLTLSRGVGHTLSNAVRVFGCDALFTG